MHIHPTHAVIDLEAIRHNLRVVRKAIGPEVDVMAVVKSNAYGHGVVAVSREAVRFGVDWLAVARVDEGCELRASGISHPTLVFEAVPPEMVTRALSDDLELTVTSLERATLIHDECRRRGTRARVHVEVDTGMGRLGIPWEEAATSIEAVARLSGLEVVGVFSHFATAEDPNQSFAREQLQRFGRVLEDLEKRRVDVPMKHMANSAAIMSLPDSHFNAVRPGVILYGLSSRRGANYESLIRPAMSLKSTISQLRTVQEGTSISYGRTYTAKRRTWIATVPIGYADGYFRALGNRSSVLIRGKRFPVVGTICMDHIMVDVGPEGSVREGDIVTIIGTDGEETISCWENAGLLGTIPYEIVCAVSSRVPRVEVSQKQF